MVLCMGYTVHTRLNYISLIIIIGFSLAALPYSRFEENENTVLVTTTHGGHFGFLEGLLPFGMNWMNRAVRQSLCALKHAGITTPSACT